MAYQQTDGISLKVLVDKEKYRIIFAECDNDFVDILFSFLTTPIGTIIRLARKNSLTVGVGCLDNLYTSVENINLRHFKNKACQAMLLSPRNSSESHCKSLKLMIDCAEPRPLFGCYGGTFNCKFLSYYEGTICECGQSMYRGISPPNTAIPDEDGGVFVKVTNRSILCDDLQVMALCSATSFSLLSKSAVTDGSTIEERSFNLTVLDLLTCALVSRTPLTETLLMHKPVPDQLNSLLHHQCPSTELKIKREMMNHDEEQNVCVKLFVSKSKKMVCYAEAKIDFVNLLFSFLTIPLGHIVKQVVDDGSLKGCISHLYKSVRDLDEQCFNSSDHKEMLVSPKVAPGFSYENELLGIKEASPPPFYYNQWYGTLQSSDEGHAVQMTLMYSKSHDKEGESRGGFLKGLNLFTVTHNLIIKPISPIFGLSILNELKVPFSDVEERIVNVEKEKALRLLVSSFVSESALTNTFLK